MASGSYGDEGGSETWNPGRSELWRQSWRDPDHPSTVLLRHPTAPFVRELAQDGSPLGVSESDLQRISFEYLTQAESHGCFDQLLPEEWIPALAPGEDDQSFGWLPIGWPPASFSQANPPASQLASFWVDRSTGAAERTVILLASERFYGPFLGSGFGIRIVAHLRPIDQRIEVAISGMSARAPFGVYWKPKDWIKEWADAAKAESFLSDLVGQKDEIAERMGFVSGSVRIQGLRLGQRDGEWVVERRGTGIAKPVRRESMAHSFVFVGDPSNAGRLVRRLPLAAEATDFERDPASMGGPGDVRRRRPSRSAADLDKFRVERPIPDPLQHGNPELMRVVVCPRFVREDRPVTPKVPDTPARPKRVALTDGNLPLRSNDLSAVNAYRAIEEFFERLGAYGISAQGYFRLAKLPLEIAYRSGIRPGPGKNGQTVNARVLPEDFSADSVGPAPLEARPRLTMHLALANLSHRARRPWNRTTPSAAEPLGIAADRRWIWHEIGHVVLMASIGELEFRFAHGPGDALAAIVADPESGLAVNTEARGRTFPWVFVPRRHDRCVAHGWSWGGVLHRDLAGVASRAKAHQKGYWSEQILSSSLFRLYRCLGGDTTEPQSSAGARAPDTTARQSASHYSVYLIVRAIQLLGASRVVLAHDPDQFVSALIDADIGTGDWTVTFPPKCGPTFHRIGGCAHKVIRWAFEAQGLYAAPGNATNAPGLPPPVDIYIEDERPSGDSHVSYGAGSYTPVSLHWSAGQAESDLRPGWHANPSAIVVDGEAIHVTIGNRGTKPATGVQVKVWWRKWPEGANPPDWNGGNNSGWNECPAAGIDARSIAPGGAETFSFSHAPPLGRYLVFAQATCADDRANTDPSTRLPCSRRATPLVDLVANDNNLGLRVVWRTEP